MSSTAAVGHPEPVDNSIRRAAPKTFTIGGVLLSKRRAAMHVGLHTLYLVRHKRITHRPDALEASCVARLQK